MPLFRATVWFNTEDGLLQRRIVEAEAESKNHFRVAISQQINKSLLDLYFGPISEKSNAEKDAHTQIHT
jgi:hypothetical protein